MRLSELYTSIQGEGPGIGRPTQFVRFAGCNLKCPGWPCDTQHAIDPKLYRHEWQTLEPYELYGRIRKNAPNLPRVTLTGGEPFLQPAEELDALVGAYLGPNYDIEIFTNGTLPFPEWVNKPNVSIIMDWKLPGSGEGDVNLATRVQNLNVLTHEDAVKFVCADKDDFLTAYEVVSDNEDLFKYIGHIYVGAAWGKVTEAEVAQWLIESGNDFKLNVQVHNYIYDRNQREI